MTPTRLLAATFGIVLALSAVLSAAGPTAAQEPPAGPAPVVEPTPDVEVTPEPSPTAEPPESPEPTGDPAPNPAGGFFGLFPDPKEWAAEVFNQVLVNLLRGIAEALHRVVGGVLASPLNFITQTPPSASYGSGTVQGLWGTVRAIANAGLGVVALWAGFNLIARGQIGSPYHEAMEIFPRLALGALLVNTSLAWGQLAIDANNALCNAIGQAGLPAWDRAGTETQLLIDVIALLIYLVTGLLLLLQMLMRMALVDLLLVAAPLGLLCWILPQTQGWARLWSSTFFGTVFTQFAQVLALKLGGTLIADLGPGSGDGALLTFFLGVAVMALTLKIPGLMRGQLGDGLGFVRYYAYRQGAAALEGRRGGEVSRPATTARPAGGA
jgi:hypothetical protein